MVFGGVDVFECSNMVGGGVGVGVKILCVLLSGGGVGLGGTYTCSTHKHTHTMHSMEIATFTSPTWFVVLGTTANALKVYMMYCGFAGIA